MEQPEGPGGRQSRHCALMLLLAGVSHGGLALAESPFPGETFTYSNPPLDIAAVTVDRNNESRTRSNTLVVVKGNPGDPQDPTFIFFSTGNECGFSEVYPVIAAYDGNAWNTISFPLARNHYWTHVYPPSPFGDRQIMYAISSYHCGESGGYYLYRSADRGRSWAVSTIEGSPRARIIALRIEADGTGELILESDNDADPVGGLHVYRTTDWGDNWSAPEFSGTILARVAQPDEYPTRERRDEIRQLALATPSPLYVSIPRLMQDIADEYTLYRERR